jgi:methionyl-tRNA formyltransferase
MMKLAFMGSPEFAVPCLRAIAQHVVLVVSQPDKPAGRGGQLASPAVKRAADELGLPTIQPKSARTGELATALRESGAELAVVVAYGKILPRAVLDAVPRGCINVHGSLLPKYRGAAPVQRAVIDGEAETGVSIMQLDEGMDTGPVYLERRVAIGADETAGELMDRLAPIGADALVEALAAIEAGTAHATPQDAARATHAAMLAKADGAIDFSGEAAAVAARIRGVDPWPGAYAMLRGQAVKLFRARVGSLVSVGSGQLRVGGRVTGSVAEAADVAPGTVLGFDGEGAHVACGRGGVVIRDIQAPSRKRLAAAQFAAGRGVAVGDVLAPDPNPP